MKKGYKIKEKLKNGEKLREKGEKNEEKIQFKSQKTKKKKDFF